MTMTTNGNGFEEKEENSLCNSVSIISPWLNAVCNNALQRTGKISAISIEIDSTNNSFQSKDDEDWRWQWGDNPVLSCLKLLFLCSAERRDDTKSLCSRIEWRKWQRGRSSILIHSLFTWRSCLCQKSWTSGEILKRSLRLPPASCLKGWLRCGNDDQRYELFQRKVLKKMWVKSYSLNFVWEKILQTSIVILSLMHLRNDINFETIILCP